MTEKTPLVTMPMILFDITVLHTWHLKLKDAQNPNQVPFYMQEIESVQSNSMDSKIGME